MSQAKVDMKKAEKKNNKNFRAVKKKNTFLTWLISIVVILALGTGVYFGTRPDYSDINVGESAFDEQSLAALFGYDGQFG